MVMLAANELRIANWVYVIIIGSRAEYRLRIQVAEQQR